MPRTSYRTRSSRTALAVWSSLALLSVAAAQTEIITEGRPAAPLPGETTGERYYERRRIKRTVFLDPTQPLEKNWDKLYDGLPGEPLKAVYFDWDDNYLYLAAHTSAPMDVRFDLDGANDGWMRGAENLSLRLIPTTDASGAQLLVRRFDTVQNPAGPVWAASPIPEEKILARMGKADSGAYALLAIPFSEVVNIKRRAGSEFGLRVSTGEQALVEPTTEPSLLRLSLADDVEAVYQGLHVHFLVRNRQIVPGQPVKATLEVSNAGDRPLLLKRYFLPDGTVIEDPNDPALVVNAGERIRKDFRFTPANTNEPLSFVLRGGVEREKGGQVFALTSVQQLDPYQLALDLDTRPILAKTPDGPARQRLVSVIVQSRKDGKTDGKLTLQLPEGWSIDGDLTRSFSLSYGPESKTISFKLRVPPRTLPGNYPLEVNAVIGGRPYHAAAVLKVK